MHKGAIGMVVRVLVIIGFFVLLMALAAWYLYKPVRIFWPTMAGVECLHENICVEKPEQFKIAQHLYDNAKKYIQFSNTDFVTVPHFIFCSTQSCYEGFGLGRSKAESFGTVTRAKVKG